jgi:cephalosporin hydroxylase/glycosyltransferase involved in cell wall biosynthesis
MNNIDTDPSNPLEGWVDGNDGHRVQGWAWYPARPDLTVSVEVLIDGKVMAAAEADGYRGDLMDLGKRDGFCGFVIPLEVEDPLKPRTVQVEVRVKEGAKLPGGVFSLQVTPRLTTLPAALSDAAGAVGFFEQFGPDVLSGWIRRPKNPSPPATIELWEAGERIFTFTADIWRADLEEQNQGDGRWGFAEPVPAVLRDGGIHVIEVTLKGDAQRITAHPLVLGFPDLPPVAPLARPDALDDDVYSTRTRPPRRDAPSDVFFSFILNFYNMPREAARTLTSLTRAYQQDIGDLAYEVLCIDNGSSPPLERAWVESFGPEFRLIRPARPSPSPCSVINEAARSAKGRYVAIMIDGAHILSPGVLREAWDSFSDTPEAVVGLRPWFVGGDQRWLSIAGYTREQEDLLFDKIGWPSYGYKLFKVSMPYWESPNHWFDGMIESNCLFVPRAVYQRIGGIDEAFDEPGAGFANLDLFKRAAAAVAEPLIALLGEATFHQFHDGTTTNVSNDEKERRVRNYENKYIRLRGAPYTGIVGVDIRQRGQMRSLTALAGRQKPPSPAAIGVTEHIRQNSMPLHFDQESAVYLQSVYVESGLYKLTRWLGHPVALAPADIVEIQDIIFQNRPERIIAVNPGPGILVLLDSLLQMAGLPASRILHVGAPEPAPASVEWIATAPCAAETLDQVTRKLGLALDILVIFTPPGGDHRPLESLRAYGRFVSYHSYLIFLNSVFGQPWIGYSKNWYKSAIKAFVAQAPFVIDQSRNRQLITTAPGGYLQRLFEDDGDDSHNALFEDQ